MIYDVLIVGSGASGVQAAFPLVESGLTVGMLDFGNEDTQYGPRVPDGSFRQVRRTDPEQHRYFLGERFEGIPLHALRVGPQLTPPRQYITKDTDQLIPIESRSFFPMTSLALGGMASGWGAGTFPYSDHDLRDFPITRKDLDPHYEKVAERIGISGEADDLYRFEGELKSMLPPLRIDQNAGAILSAYQKRRERLNAAGFYMGKPRLAALSRSYRGRGPDRYLDMSFWGDADRSVWRPVYSLDELRSFKNFSYLRPYLVELFKERNDGTVEVVGRNMAEGRVETHRAQKLILAAGLLSTARIVLRSMDKYGVRIPFVSNPYTYYPMLNLNMIGKVPEEHSHSLAQLCVIYDPREPGQSLVHGRVHSYRSLLNFRLIKETPLPFREAMRVIKILAPCLAIVALDHEDRPGPDKYCALHRGESGRPDRLEIVYSLPDEIRKRQIRHEKRVIRHFRSLGCIALKRVWPGYGASLHYGGTFPMMREDRELTVGVDGLLRRTRSVYIVDGSVFPYLPPKGMTFTMMANANRIAEGVAKELKP